LPLMARDAPPPGPRIVRHALDLHRRD
jgi:hypothetical protein